MSLKSQLFYFFFFWLICCNKPKFSLCCSVIKLFIYHLFCRNVSSAGFDARRRMRECKGLVNALIHVLKLAAGDADSNAIDNKVSVFTVYFQI